jgi:hypothetical protein
MKESGNYIFSSLGGFGLQTQREKEETSETKVQGKEKIRIIF